jgi:crotonobetainyl-CoA:carnitine CoA-transferase CaiB-like acyl-CoA transferase
LRLVAASDVVFSSKPGPWTPLRLRFDELQAVNPAIVADDSSALSRTGPASRRMGYGPLVRAAPA